MQPTKEEKAQPGSILNIKESLSHKKSTIISSSVVEAVPEDSNCVDDISTPPIASAELPELPQVEELHWWNKYHENIADIRVYPEIINKEMPHVITFGDLHGNFMKLIWSLVQNGVLEMEPDTFNKLWRYYEQMDISYAEFIRVGGDKSGGKGIGVLDVFASIIGAGVEGIDELLKRVRLKPGYKLRFLGDMLADRGANDILMVKFLKFLRDGGIDYEIVLSNHDLDFIMNYDLRIKDESIKKWDQNIDWRIHNTENQENSLLGLYSAIKAGVVEHREVIEAVDKYILPYVHPLSYSLSDDGEEIDLFMHAPNDFEIIAILGSVLEAIKEDKFYDSISGLAGYKYEIKKSAADLAQAINEINKTYSDIFKNGYDGKKNGISLDRVRLSMPHASLPDFEGSGDGLKKLFLYMRDGFALSKDPCAFKKELTLAFCLSRLIWNRFEKTRNPEEIGKIDFSTYPDFVAHVVHGHTYVNIPASDTRQICLDEGLGKTLRSVGKYELGGDGGVWARKYKFGKADKNHVNAYKTYHNSMERRVRSAGDVCSSDFCYK